MSEREEKMKDIELIISYYDESKRKSKRRVDLLSQLFEHIVVNRKYNDNMSQICKAINVERKTVYRYYANREAIIVELLFLIHAKRNLEFTREIEKVMVLEELSLVEKFYVILDINVELLVKYQSDLSFSEYAKKIAKQMDQNSVDYKRHEQMMNEQKFNHYLPILLELEKAGLLRKQIIPEEYSDMIDESLNAFVFQTLEYKDTYIRYNFNQIERFINLVKLGLVAE